MHSLNPTREKKTVIKHVRLNVKEKKVEPTNHGGRPAQLAEQANLYRWNPCKIQGLYRGNERGLNI